MSRFDELQGGDLPKRRADIAKFDDLGPLTRAAISEAPIDIKVAQMIAQAPMRCFVGNDARLDDRALADWLRSYIRQRFGKPAEAFVLVPAKRAASASARLAGR